MDEQQISIHINFPLVPGEDGYFAERKAFWDSPATVQWFKGHGYTLYERLSGSPTTRPRVATKITSTEGDYPHAYYDPGGPEGMSEQPRVEEYSGKVAFAQDSFNRHFAIKLVRAETDEYRILRFLSEQKLETLKENCVVPVLDLLPIEGFWFAVMPRWGIDIIYPPMYHIHEFTTMMYSMLKSLAYLHEHNIVHHDIALKNILVNHFAYDEDRALPEHTTRGSLRSRKCLLYAIFDFDCSIMISPKANKKAFRLPYYESWGSFNMVKDTAAGEFDYNPFVFDVGVMGALISSRFQHMSPEIPFLAPLLDKMTTWDLDRRFTAPEALRFFEDRISELSEDQLQAVFHGEMRRTQYDTYDRWEGLSPDFVERWKAYRVAPLPWHMRLLRPLCQKAYICHIVPKTRLFFYRLARLPHQLYTWIIPSKIAI